MDTKELASWGVKGVLCVSGARLVLVFLRMDGIGVPTLVEAGLLTLSGIFGAVALTGLAMVLADGLTRAHSLGRKLFLGIAWLGFLAAMCWLIPPYMVAKIRTTELVSVLNTPAKQWAWAIVATLVVEVMAAGGVIAMRETESDTRRNTSGVSFGQVIGQIGGAVATRIEQGGVQPQPANVQRQAQPAPQQTTHKVSVTEEQDSLTHPIDDARRVRNEQRELSKKERQDKMVNILRVQPDISKTELADMLNVVRSTVYSDLSDLEDDNRIIRDDDGIHVIDVNGRRDEPVPAEVHRE